MPITFGCECGKQFAVADEFAGKRTRCPACGSALTVPALEAAPVPAQSPSEEDEAYRLLMDGNDPEPVPAPAPARRDPAPDDYSSRSAPSAAPSAPPPAPKRGPRFVMPSADEQERPRRPAIHISPAVLGGLLLMLLAAAWFGLGLAAGYIYFYPPFMFAGGFVTFVRGLLGHSED